MRTNFFGNRILQPGDTVDTVMDAWPDFNPTFVRIYDQPDETYLYGGEAVDDDTGNTEEFDGFDSVDAARTFAVEVLGIAAGDIHVRDG